MVHAKLPAPVPDRIFPLNILVVEDVVASDWIWASGHGVAYAMRHLRVVGMFWIEP